MTRIMTDRPHHLKHAQPKTRNLGGMWKLSPIHTGHACKLEPFPFDVSCMQCGYPYSHQQVPFACIALRIASPRPVWIGPYIDPGFDQFSESIDQNVMHFIILRSLQTKCVSRIFALGAPKNPELSLMCGTLSAIDIHFFTNSLRKFQALSLKHMWCPLKKNMETFLGYLPGGIHVVFVQRNIDSTSWSGYDNSTLFHPLLSDRWDPCNPGWTAWFADWIASRLCSILSGTKSGTQKHRPKRKKNVTRSQFSKLGNVRKTGTQLFFVFAWRLPDPGKTCCGQERRSRWPLLLTTMTLHMSDMWHVHMRSKRGLVAAQ